MTAQFQDRGRSLQKDLLGGWYRELGSARAEGRKTAYLFISGNVVELLRVFDFVPAYPEVNALQCGIKKSSPVFIGRAEDLGYSGDVCAYVKNDVGLSLPDSTGPWGRISPPDLLVCTYSGCNTYIKWFEMLAHRFGAELFVLDVPHHRGAPAAQDVRYVVRQLEELIGVCERITGIPYDEEKLKAILRSSAEAEGHWDAITASPKRRPSPFDGYFEAVFFMAPIYVLRGTEACADYYRQALAEIREREALGIGPVPEERFRIVVEGPPPWPHFRNFWELFKRWGAVSVFSTYARVGGVWDGGVRHDPARPLESLAEYAMGCYTNLSLEERAAMLDRAVRDYQADALVIHSVKSCRVFSVGQADLREEFSRERGVPTLFLESDLVDPRYFSEAQMKNRIDAFFESLEHMRLMRRPAAAQAGSATPAPRAPPGPEVRP
jgi:benzoyl-CoA reductase subunit B